MAKNEKVGSKLRRVGKATTIDESKLIRFIDPRLVVALSHDVRQHILAVLNDEISSPTDIGKALGVGPTYLNHHFEVLEENGLIELVRVERVRGVKKHYYRAKETFVFQGESWDRLPATFKSGVCGSELNSIYKDAAEALMAGTFTARDEVHVSWTSMPLDSTGFSDLSAVLLETLEKIQAIKVASAARLEAREEPAIPTTVGMLSFEMPSASMHAQSD